MATDKPDSAGTSHGPLDMVPADRSMFRLAQRAFRSGDLNSLVDEIRRRRVERAVRQVEEARRG